MAKTIKFNLICDTHQVRTLEGVREHFSIEDMLHYYQNGLLEKWLMVRGFANELEKLKEIHADTDAEIVKALANLFEVEVDEQDVIKIVSDWKEWSAEKEGRRDFENQRRNNQKFTQEAVGEYFTGYRKNRRLLCGAKEHMYTVRSALEKIANDYYRIFELDYANLFECLRRESPYALMAMMGVPKLRAMYLPPSEVERSGYYRALIHALFKEKGTESVQIKTQLKKLFGEKLRVFDSSDKIGNKDLWYQVEEKGKRCIVLWKETKSIYPGIRKVYIRPAEGDESMARDVSEAISSLEVFDGIECECGETVKYLLYYLEI